MGSRGVFIVENQSRPTGAGPGATAEASPVSALRGTVPRSRQRPRAVSSLVDLNFKVPAQFRQRFKRIAGEADLKHVQLLRRALDAYEREHRIA